MSSKGRPAARVAVLTGSWQKHTLSQTFELTSAKTDLSTVLLDLGTGLRSHLAGINADRVVLRRADVGVASRKEGPRIRLLAEGALAGAAREILEDVVLLTGKDLAAKSSAGSKEDLEDRAALLTTGDHQEAAAAALAGLDL